MLDELDADSKPSSRKRKIISMQGSKSIPLIALLLAMTTVLLPTLLRAQTSASELNASGKWKGTRTVTGQTGGPEEFKIHSISFDLKQNSDSVSGSYRCYAGNKANIDCNNPIGQVISGTVKLSNITMQVQAMPNNLQCTFEGSLEAAKMRGRFTCYVGGSLATTGVWEVHRY
jgi:hypothetical protein